MSADTPGEALGRLLEPRSVAVVGASTDQRKIGSRVLQLLDRYGYRGQVFPVNPKCTTIGELACYPSVGAVGMPADTTIIAVPAARVRDSVIEACESGAKALIVYASGFAEIGPEGARAQRELDEIVSSHGAVLCGPNCQGVANFNVGFAGNFSTVLFGELVRPGPLALVGQSGMFGAVVFDRLRAMKAGVGYLVATGNEANLGAFAVAGGLLEKPDVSVVAMCVESVRESDELTLAATIAAKSGKTLCVLKVGRSAPGRRAAQSHTAAMPVDNTVFDAVCERYGILRLERLQDLVDITYALSRDVPQPAGRGVGIVTNTGGVAVHMADIADDVGLSVAELSPASVSEIDEVLDPVLARRNPLDAAGLHLDAPDRYQAMLCAVAADASIEQVQVFVGIDTWSPADTARAIVNAKNACGKPFVATWLGSGESGAEVLRDGGVPAFPDPARSLAVAANLCRLADLRSRRLTEPIGARDRRPAESGLWFEHWDERHTAEFARHGVNAADTVPAAGADSAIRFAEAAGYPVALKLSSRRRTHKSDIGGVALGLTSAEQLRTAFAKLAAMLDGPDECLVVQKMANTGVELFLSLTRDPIFGRVLLVASGGLGVESATDLQAIVPPVDAESVGRALRGLTTYRLLLRARGRQGASIPRLVDTIVGLGHLLDELPDDIHTLEINPLIVPSGEECPCAVDWRADRI